MALLRDWPTGLALIAFTVVGLYACVLQANYYQNAPYDAAQVTAAALL